MILSFTLLIDVSNFRFTPLVVFYTLVLLVKSVTDCCIPDWLQAAATSRCLLWYWVQCIVVVVLYLGWLHASALHSADTLPHLLFEWFVWVVLLSGGILHHRL